MKKTIAIAVTVVLVGGLATFASAHGGRSGGNMMWGRDTGSYGWGRNMYPQQMNGRDFESRGQGYGPGYCRSNVEGVRGFGEVSQAETAAEIVTWRLEAGGNPNLEVGKVTEVARAFEVEIVTKDGSLVNKVLIEKSTGRLLSAYNN